MAFSQPSELLVQNTIKNILYIFINNLLNY